MNLTERAELILDIAKRIKAERDAGRSVDPSRLEWAEQIVKGNATSRAQEAPEADLRAGGRALSQGAGS